MAPPGPLQKGVQNQTRPRDVSRSALLSPWTALLPDLVHFLWQKGAQLEGYNVAVFDVFSLLKPPGAKMRPKRSQNPRISKF